MHYSSLSANGQVTIPADIRKQLGMHPGDKVSFVVENDRVIVFCNKGNIEKAFGICHPKVSASLEDIEQATHQ